MKPIRFIMIAIAICLVFAAFAPYPTQKNFAAVDTANQPSGLGVLESSFESPFLLASSAPVVSIITDASYGGYACLLKAQSPPDWTVMKRRNIFDVYWTLKNTGSKVWGLHGVDVKFRGGYPKGTVMHYNVPNLFDIPKKVGPGGKITLGMDMMAPRKPGYYVENWGLYVGGQVFCKFYIAVTVTW